MTRNRSDEVNRVPQVASLPPAGPAWFSSVMGTGILALLVELHLGRTPIGGVAALALLMLAWALLLGLGGAFVARCCRDPRELRASWTGPAGAAAWGTVSMGILSVGSATLKVAVGQGIRSPPSGSGSTRCSGASGRSSDSRPPSAS
ncbi:hypothetical protein [Branchiibius cervicis]|uniref:Uncharacterized protein n=1 Tax=Branchiibius cervicis TaxID=908252 RepID=A0ABW2AXR5_9MICO